MCGTCCVANDRRRMFPLLLKDGLLMPYVVLVGGYFFGTVWPALRVAEPPISESLRPNWLLRCLASVCRCARWAGSVLSKRVVQATLAVLVLLHGLWAMALPSRYPDMATVVLCAYGCVMFVLSYCLGVWLQVRDSDKIIPPVDVEFVASQKPKLD